MSVEHFSGDQKNSGRETPLVLRNRMQIELADRFYGFPSGGKRLEWIEKNGEAFATLIARKPELLERFRKDPSPALEEAERELYVPHF